MSKILGLSIEGLRKIKVAELDFSKGNLIQIRGRNEAGKSTILLAIEVLFGGAGIIPKDVITHGKEKAIIIGKIDDYTITRIIQKNGNSSISVKKDGMIQTKPQDFLNMLAGKFLDPQWFSELSGVEMKKVLMKYLGIDFTEIDRKIKDGEQQRLLIGRELKSIGEKEAVGKTEKIQVSELIDQREEIIKYNEEQEEQQKEVDETQKELNMLTKERMEIDNKIKKIEQVYKNLPIPKDNKDIEKINEQIKNSDIINKQANDYERYVEWKKRKEEKQIDYKNSTEEISNSREIKEKMLVDTKMPLDGLKITDNGLSYNDITNENWSDSESLKISMYISAKLSKDLKTLFIKRGESLDSKSLEEIKKFADESGYQVIIEIVDDKYNLTDDNVFYIEEGEIIDIKEEK